MKGSFLLILLFQSVMSFAQQKIVAKIKVDSVDREFIVVKPSGAAPVGGYPVVFMFHGTSGDGEKFYNISGWKEKGEVEKIITVFPSSLAYCVLNEVGQKIYTTKWNCADLVENQCKDLNQNLKDDVKFVRKMVDTIKATFNVNPKKFFASGFSNGSVFTFKLAMDAPDIFEAVATASGPLLSLDSLKPAKTVRIWNTLGTDDPLFEDYLGVSPLPFGGDSILYYYNSVINRVLGCEGLSNNYNKFYSPITNTFVYQTPLAGNPNTIYMFTLMKGLTHEYPNGVNYPLVGADIFWNFFNKTLILENSDISTNYILKCYPNPSQNEIYLEFGSSVEGESVDIQVVDVFGKLVFSQKNINHHLFILKKESIGIGVFGVKCTIGNKVFSNKIIFN